MKRILTAAILAAACGIAFAQAAPVVAEGAWARASVQGQMASGAFVRLTPKEAITLTGVASPVAGVAELHEMKLDGDVMRMRAIDAVQLPAGKTFELKPGGHHVMLMDLKAPLKPDTRIPLTLTFRNAKGEASRLELSVPVLTRPPEGTADHKH